MVILGILGLFAGQSLQAQDNVKLPFVNGGDFDNLSVSIISNAVGGLACAGSVINIDNLTDVGTEEDVAQISFTVAIGLFFILLYND